MGHGSWPWPGPWAPWGWVVGVGASFRNWRPPGFGNWTSRIWKLDDRIWKLDSRIWKLGARIWKPGFSPDLETEKHALETKRHALETRSPRQDLETGNPGFENWLSWIWKLEASRIWKLGHALETEAPSFGNWASQDLETGLPGFGNWDARFGNYVETVPEGCVADWLGGWLSA